MLMDVIEKRLTTAMSVLEKYPLFTKGSIVAWATHPDPVPFLYARVLELFSGGFLLDRYPHGVSPTIMDYGLVSRTKYGFTLPGNTQPTKYTYWVSTLRDRRTNEAKKTHYYLWPPMVQK